MLFDPFPVSDDNRLVTCLQKLMEKRDHPPKGFYKSLKVPVDFLFDRS